MDKGFLNNLVWVPKLVCGRLKPLGYNTGSVSGGRGEGVVVKEILCAHHT